MSETRIDIPKILKKQKIVVSKGPDKGRIIDPNVAHEEANTILESIGYASSDTYKLKDDAIKALSDRSKDYVLTSQAAKTEDAQKKSEIDDLTHTHNRKGINRRMNEAVAHHERTGAAYGVLFMDIDGFRKFNNTNGHAAGDDVLRKFSGIFRKDELFGRYGGDEFVLLYDLKENNTAEEIMKRLTTFFQDKLQEDSRWKNLAVSVGLRTLQGQTHVDALTLLKDADAAMYEAKRFPGTHLTEWQQGMKPPPEATFGAI